MSGPHPLVGVRGRGSVQRLPRGPHWTEELVKRYVDHYVDISPDDQPHLRQIPSWVHIPTCAPWELLIPQATFDALCEADWWPQPADLADYLNHYELWPDAIRPQLLGLP